jgi:hypothetical protein
LSTESSPTSRANRSSRPTLQCSSATSCRSRLWRRPPVLLGREQE